VFYLHSEVNLVIEYAHMTEARVRIIVHLVIHYDFHYDWVYRVHRTHKCLVGRATKIKADLQ
jgi:hypothetical protein